MEKEQLLKELGFKKRWTFDKSGYWWEKKYRTKLGKFDLSVDESFGKYIITLGVNIYDIKEIKWSEKNIRKWDEYLTKIGKIHFS